MSGLTTAADGFLAEALRLGGGMSPFAVASAGMAAADCLRFVAAIAIDVIWTRLVAPGRRGIGLDDRYVALTALDGTMALLLRSRTANMNTRGLVQERLTGARGEDRLEAHKRRQPLLPLVMVTQGRVAMRLD